MSLKLCFTSTSLADISPAWNLSKYSFSFSGDRGWGNELLLSMPEVSSSTPEITAKKPSNKIIASHLLN